MLLGSRRIRQRIAGAAGDGEAGDGEAGGDSRAKGVVAAELPLSLLRLPPPSLLRLLCAPAGPGFE